MTSTDTVRVDDVLAHLIRLEEDQRERADCMGVNMAHHDARVLADGIATAIDAIRDEFGGTV